MKKDFGLFQKIFGNTNQDFPQKVERRLHEDVSQKLFSKQAPYGWQTQSNENKRERLNWLTSWLRK